MGLIKYLFYSKKYNLLNKNNNTPLFTLKGKIFMCKVVEVYDGDSCKVVFCFNKKYYKWNIRMLGYDSPEIRISKYNIDRDHLKKIALKAKKHFIKLLNYNNNNNTQLLYIKCYDFDKYGRLLAELYFKYNDAINNINSINSFMIISGNAIPYYGGKKKSFV